MTIEENKETFRRFVEEALGGGHIEVLPELVADDFCDHAAMPGQESGCAGLMNKVRALRAAFPDLSTRLLMLVAEGDIVVGRVRISGAHSGSLMGIEPTNRSIDVTEFHAWRFERGKGVEHWEGGDKLRLLHQLGFELMPPRAPSSE